MKPEGTRYRATTQVKGLSPEIPVLPEAEAFHVAAGSILITAKRGYENLAGSETVARYQRDELGTRETHNVPDRVCTTKPINGKVVQMTLWESDKPIVAMKPRNGGGAKGLTGVRRDGRDTSATLRGGARMSTKLPFLTLKARENPKLQFTSLAHLFTEDFLLECFGELKKNKASGIDGVGVSEYEVNLKENIRDLVKRLKAKRYRPQPVRRVYIPKPNGEKRPLGIPTVEDKVVQMGCKKILEEIFEVDFLDVSYGFRPHRGCHEALDELDRVIMSQPVNYVVDMDIEKFFDRVNHQWLMECLKQRIADSSFLRVIARFLKAGVIEEGKHWDTDEGTPQGGVLSPILANIYLHYILDLWFEKGVKGRLKGYAQLVRYADDFIVCFQSGREAKAFKDKLNLRLGKFGLKIAREKSRIIEFGRYVWGRVQRRGEKIATFDFLGFTHYCDKTRSGKFKLGRKTAKLRFRRALREMNEWLKGIRNRIKLQEWWEMLAIKLLGYYRYYGISGNMRWIAKFYWRTLSLVYKWINRRSQKASYNWEQFCRWLKYHPLPKPKIYHFYPILRGCTSEEPND